jgi:exodeoxyribonuclease VII small subunit
VQKPTFLTLKLSKPFKLFFNMTKQKLTYTEAVAELEKILAELENNSEVNMDVIAEKVKRAAVLMEFCKKQLHELDDELEKMIEQLD